MGHFSGVRRTILSSICLCASMAAYTGAQQPVEEESAFVAARANANPDQRSAALENFLVQFPSGARADTARGLLLDTYLLMVPAPESKIHAVAAAQVAATPAGLQRWLGEARLADRLATAGDAALQDASRWATDAALFMTESAYVRQSQLLQRRFGLPKLSPKQLHHQFALDRVRVLSSMANVQLRLGNDTKAEAALTEASRLHVPSSELFSLQGQLALRRQNKQQALADFTQASALAPLPERWQTEMEALFREETREGDDALQASIDAAYRARFPAIFTLPQRTLPAGGHPVLLELFTGSDCAPCAGPDLAVDSLLSSYPRRDLIALEYDEHIPRPDPLATQGTAERAAFYGVEATPQAFLDGEPAQLLGSSREDVENIVVGLGEQIEDAAALPSALRLTVTATRPAEDVVATAASLAVGRAPSVEGLPTTGDVSLRALQHAVVYTALAEDQVRYMGQNGVRFHRMVVRALRQFPAASLLGSPDQIPHELFRLRDIERDQTAYLRDFQEHNDSFGSFTFPTIRIPIHTDHLAVVIWVQDSQSRKILQSTFAALQQP